MLIRHYHEDDVTVFWDPDDNWVYVDWRNAPTKQTVIEGCEEALNLLISNKASQVLNDNRQVTGTWVRASNWVAEGWLPRMIAAGLKKFAWIESPVSTLSVISAKRAAMKNQAGVIRLFKDESDAKKWLKE